MRRGEPTILVGLPTLIERLVATSGTRRMIGVCGPPGSGKSFLCDELVRSLPDRAIAVVPMDGFHLDDGVLVELGLANVKGRADTFDAAGFVSLLQRLRARPREIVYAPRFDRALETAVAGALAIGPEIEIVLVEGNYLLLDHHPWVEIVELLDETWYLDVPAAVRHGRLVVRHRLGHGEQAEDWIARVDVPNAAIVTATRARASAVVRR